MKRTKINAKIYKKVLNLSKLTLFGIWDRTMTILEMNTNTLSLLICTIHIVTHCYWLFLTLFQIVSLSVDLYFTPHHLLFLEHIIKTTLQWSFYNVTQLIVVRCNNLCTKVLWEVAPVSKEKALLSSNYISSALQDDASGGYQCTPAGSHHAMTSAFRH